MSLNNLWEVPVPKQSEKAGCSKHTKINEKIITDPVQQQQQKKSDKERMQVIQNLPLHRDRIIEKV